MEANFLGVGVVLICTIEYSSLPNLRTGLAPIFVDVKKETHVLFHVWTPISFQTLNDHSPNATNGSDFWLRKVVLKDCLKVKHGLSY